MQVLGDFTTADTLYVFFDTYDANGASVTISGLAVTDIEIYKNGSVTQRASDNGYALLDTDGIDFDGAVGLHGFSINLADNSDAGFYSNGAQYVLNVNAITVAGQTVRFSYQFTIGRLLKPTTAGQTLNLTAGDVTAFSLNAGARGDVALAVLGATALDWITAGTIGFLISNTDSNASEIIGDTGTLKARIGAFTGTGLNTILGFFRAIFNKAAALTPSDLSVGATGNNTTDSLEAIRDRGDVAWITGTGGGGGGTGTVPIDHNGGAGATVDGAASTTDILRYLDLDGAGADGLIVRAYLASEYDADPPLRTAKGATSTGPDGRWVAPLMLDPGTYYVIADSTGDAFRAQKNTVVVV